MGAQARRQPPGGRRPRLGLDPLARPPARQRLRPQGHLPGRGRGQGPVRVRLAPLPRGRAADGRPARRARLHPGDLGGLGLQGHPRGHLARRRGPLDDHPEGADLRPDRRHRGRRDDEPARGPRRRAQLGLPVLLAARRLDDPRRPADQRLPRRGQGVARVAAARDRRSSPGPPDHVRRGRRAPPPRDDPRLAARLRELPARSGSATAPRASSSSTSTARWSTRSTTRGRAGCPRRPRLEADPQDDGLPGDRLEPARRGPVGGARPAPPVHALQGHGLGRLRPGDQDAGEAAPLGPDREVEKALRDQIHQEVCDKAFDDPERNTFTQSYGSKELDASSAAHPHDGLPAGRRPARDRHHQGHRARADHARGLRAALLDQRAQPGRRAARP